MLDLDRFIFELDRLTTAVHFYDEVYCDKDAINTLERLSNQATKIIQLSVHNDIVMTTARLLYDGDKYKVSGKVYEYLSQYNLAKKYEKYIDSTLQVHRDRVAEIKEEINVKDYRDFVLAHNDKATLTGQNEYPKHNIETKLLLEMLQKSRLLFFGIRIKFALEEGETSLPVTDCNVCRDGVGSNFIRNIKNITRRCS